MTVSAGALRDFQRSLALDRNVLRAVWNSPWLRIMGPAFAVSIGYIDPGNWATDLASGSYGYRLLWVVMIANVIAVVLQLAVTKVTIVTGSDLATLISRRWKNARTIFWLVFQGAAIATDLAEFGGVVLGLQLLFRWPIVVSVVAGLAIVSSIMLLSGRLSKTLEYAMMGALLAVSLGFLYQLLILHPSWSAVALGATVPNIPDGAAIVIAVGIIGATVMPHNLFLHSSLVHKNCADASPAERAKRGRFFARETLLALTAAAFVNAAILIVGAGLHGANGSVENAFASLAPVGAAAAAIFGAALLISGIAASVTATVSGDYIFAAFSPKAISPVIRRGVTLVPAAVVIVGGISITNLLIWSQVALAFVLPVALIPLVLIMLERRVRGTVSPHLITSTIAMSAACVGFDAVTLLQKFF
jgi:manganese transport protein